MVSWGWLFDVGGGGNRTGGIGGLVQCAGATGAVRSTFVGLGGLGLARGCSAVADAPEAWLRPCEEAKRDRGNRLNPLSARWGGRQIEGLAGGSNTLRRRLQDHVVARFHVDVHVRSHLRSEELVHVTPRGGVAPA